MCMAAVIAAMAIATHQLLEDEEDELDEIEREMKEEEKRIEGDDD